MDTTSSDSKRSWIDGVPSKAAMGLGAALGVGLIGVVGFFVLLPGAIRGSEDAPATPEVPAQPAAPAPAPEAPPAPVDITVTSDDHIRGNPDAPITIVEWSDLQCPFCSRFHPTVQQALTEYGDDVRWVYRHFPLDSIHPQARPAAEASECAAEQGKFWEFTDAMFAQQDKLGPAFYTETAASLGLDAAQFDTCVTSRQYEAKVRSQESAGLAAGVRGTPGSFVNGIELGGAVPYAQIKAVIDSLR